MLGEAGTGGQQGVDLSGALQDVEPAQGGDDALADAAVTALVVDDLQVVVSAAVLEAYEHREVSTGHY